MPIDFHAMNAKAIAEFRANGGVCGPPFEDTPIVLVTMKGAKSGRELCSPLAYSTDGEDVVVIASMGGAPNNPNWYHNLLANPDAEVQVKGDVIPVRAHTAEGAEREELWNLACVQWPNYNEYTKRTDRVIPVVVLEQR